MEWDDIRKIRRFMTMEEVFKQIGKPKFKIQYRNLYYMGDGFFIGYCKTQFSLSGKPDSSIWNIIYSGSIEAKSWDSYEGKSFNIKTYGNEGEYAINIYFFPTEQDIRECLNINTRLFQFGDINKVKRFNLTENIKFGDYFLKVNRKRKELRKINIGTNKYFGSGSSGKSESLHMDNYEFYYLKTSLFSKMNGFRVTL